MPGTPMLIFHECVCGGYQNHSKYPDYLWIPGAFCNFHFYNVETLYTIWWYTERIKTQESLYILKHNHNG